MALNAKPKRIVIKQSKKVIIAKNAAKRAAAAQTEPELADHLGTSANFVLKVYRRFDQNFHELNHDPKKCSAYLNLVANVRMLDGRLWTDKAVISMFRRARKIGGNK